MQDPAMEMTGMPEGVVNLIMDYRMSTSSLWRMKVRVFSCDYPAHSGRGKGAKLGRDNRPEDPLSPVCERVQDPARN